MVPEFGIGVLGARSLIGAPLLVGLAGAGYRVTAFSRDVPPHPEGLARWCLLPKSGAARHALPVGEPLPLWICAAPIWVLPEHFELLAAHGARRVVALSSTSRFTKDTSADPAERALATRLAAAEAMFQDWAERHGIDWVILRPTLIYGLGRDRNIREIARFIRRFGFFPLVGGGRGLRQPVHACDVAAACVAALTAPAAVNRAYELSGGETITYREMVCRVFAALDRPPRLVPVPKEAARLVITLLRLLPRCRHWSPGMVERMGRDLVFDHAAAVRDFRFTPGDFRIHAGDLNATE